MTYHGRIKDGVVVLDQAGALPDGTEVRVEPVPRDGTPGEEEKLPPWGEVLKDFIGALEGMPEDLAAQHDHYLHGTPKKRNP